MEIGTLRTLSYLHKQKNAPPVSLVGAIDSIAEGSAVMQVPNLGQNLQNGTKIN